MSRTAARPGASSRGGSDRSRLAVVALAVLVWKRREIFLTESTGWRRVAGRFAEWFVYAGIVGNLLDRVVRGYVIDFLDFHWGVHHFPCFNLADVYICVAAGLMILASFGEQKHA